MYLEQTRQFPMIFVIREKKGKNNVSTNRPYSSQRHYSLQKANKVGGTKDVVRRGSTRHT